MNIWLLVIRLILAAVFGIAALSKWRNMERTRVHLRDAGLPHTFIGLVAIGLPVIEIGTAIALTLEPLHQIGAFVALLLLITFSAYIVLQLKRGNRANCACFGTLTDFRFGPSLLMRNATLMLLAGLLLIPKPIYINVSAYALAAVVLVLCVIALAYGCIQLMRQQGRLLLRIEQLEQREFVSRNIASLSQAPSASSPSQLPSTEPLQVGQRIPDWPFIDAAGIPMNLINLFGAPFNIVFLDQTCLHCRAIFARLRDGLPAVRTVVFISGPRAHQATFAPGILAVNGNMPAAMRIFGIHSTPAMVQVQADGRIIGAPITGASAVIDQLGTSNNHSADQVASILEVSNAIPAL